MPLWIRLWFVSVLEWVNAMKHTSQTYGLSPLWKRLCVVRVLVHLNALSQMLQVNRLMLLWMASLWLLSSLRYLNLLWHKSHSCGLSAACGSWEVEFLYFCAHVLLLYIRSVSSVCCTSAPLNISWPALRNWLDTKLDNTSSSSSFTSTSLPFITLLCDKLDETSLWSGSCSRWSLTDVSLSVSIVYQMIGNAVFCERLLYAVWNCRNRKTLADYVK